MLKVISRKGSDSATFSLSSALAALRSVVIADGGGGGVGDTTHVGISPAIAGTDRMKLKAAAAQRVRKVFIVFS
jgi:hypothetical protein